MLFRIHVPSTPDTAAKSSCSYAYRKAPSLPYILHTGLKHPSHASKTGCAALVAAALGVLVVRHGAVLGIAVELAVAVLVVDEGRVEEEGEEDDAIMVEKEARLVT